MSAHVEECLYIPTTGIKESCPWEGAVGNVVKEIQLKNPKIRVTQGFFLFFKIIQVKYSDYFLITRKMYQLSHYKS